MIKKILKQIGNSYILRLNYFRESSLNKDFIYKTILRTEEWREKYNKKYIGRGIDPYYESHSLDFPMAYAFYIRGYLQLYKFSKNKKWLEKAINAEKILNGLRVKKVGAWCLPFEWKNNKEEPYLITNAIVGHSLMDLYENTKDKRYLKRVKNIINWMINSLGYSSGKMGICFWYSPRMKKHVINASAQAMSLISRYIYFSGENSKLKKVEKDAFRYVEGKKLKNYIWDYYGEEKEYPKNKIDFHNNYIIESNYYFSLHDKDSKARRETVILPFLSLSQKILNKNGSLKFLVNEFREAELWGYAAFLYTGLNVLELTSGKEKFKIEKILKRLLRYIFSHLYNSKEGIFKYKSNKKEFRYIRHSAHIFYAMSKLLNSKLL